MTAMFWEMATYRIPKLSLYLSAYVYFLRAGKVSTYKALSDALCLHGVKSASRAGTVTRTNKVSYLTNSIELLVGGALRHNPHAPVVPCHRVIASNLKIGGFSGA